MAERAMMLGWREVVEAVFEVQGFKGDAVVLDINNVRIKFEYLPGRGILPEPEPGLFTLSRPWPSASLSGAIRFFPQFRA